MHIAHLTVKNFRAIENINCEFTNYINVIVGPNAVGKSTLLQSIRLAKALLAPRTNSESQQTLISLGAASPLLPQKVFWDALARDKNKLIEIFCSYSLTEDEIDIIYNEKLLIIQNIVAAQTGQNFTNPSLLIQFMQSEMGKNLIKAQESLMDKRLEKLRNDKILTLGVSINPLTQELSTVDLLAGPLIGFLDQRLAPHVSIFSYFPADRALPMGEVPMQIGSQDAQQQLESHNSQPQLKYSRLKNLIINSIVMNISDGKPIQDEFEKIFTSILRGRKIKHIGVSERGMFSVLIEEISTGRVIEIDNLSGGEKNLALTFLLIARTVHNGGIALFDEPELHLNPAVSKQLLSLLLNDYSKPKPIQFILCTHSPEILSGAFQSEDCTLLHLNSPTNIAKVGKKAIDECSDALQRLGTSVVESLFYDGTVLVEGESDVEFLEYGFPDLFKKLSIKERGGRRDVEKNIKRIQELEKNGQIVPKMFIIIDLDDEKTEFNDSNAVRILQWNRRCVENYLIDIDVITELLKDTEITLTPVSNEGETNNLLRDIAFRQIDEFVARKVYLSLGYENASLRKDDVHKSSMDEIVDSLYKRMLVAKNSIRDMEEYLWKKEFKENCNIARREMELTWNVKWKELCDGKILISELCKHVKLNRLSESAFKAKIIQKMKSNQSENWRIVRSLLEELLAPR